MKRKKDLTHVKYELIQAENSHEFERSELENNQKVELSQLSCMWNREVIELRKKLTNMLGEDCQNRLRVQSELAELKSRKLKLIIRHSKVIRPFDVEEKKTLDFCQLSHSFEVQ